MPDIEDEIIASMHTLKALVDKVYRCAREKKNEKIQEEIKEILGGFTKELQKGIDNRDELKGILDKQRNEFLRVKNELGIDDKKLDDVIEKARESVKEKSKSKEKEQTKHKDRQSSKKR